MPDQTQPHPNRFHFREETVNSLKAWTAIGILYLVLFVFLSIALAPNGNKHVYITRTGECYHNSGCSSLNFSKFQTTLKKAVDSGYRRCNNCSPPSLISGNVKLKFSFTSVLSLLLGSFGLSIFVWMYAVFVFHLFRIPDDQIRLRWYPISAILFLSCLLLLHN